MGGRGSSGAALELPSLEFRVLGPLEVRRGRGPLSLDGGRPRALLALLLVHRGELVSVDLIVDELWGESPPSSARHMVEVYVSKLRKALGKGRLVRESAGYALRLEADEVDAAHFERLCAEGQEALRAGDAQRASVRLGESLELWRGPALAEFAYERFAEVEARRLEELRLHAEEELVDAELALGHDADLVPKLERLVAQAPLRERRHKQLMLALAGAGRQADTLAAYRAARNLLVEGLGLEPSDELRRLERAILAQEELSRTGAAGADAEQRATRRVVTVLFAELADEGAGADPEVARGAAARTLEPARRAVERHEGSLSELPDGTIMGVFGSTVAHEDDSLRALRAADELRAGGLALRIGIDTGEALVAAGEVSGDVVRSAARLREGASSGEIMVGEQTRLLAGEEIRLDPLWDEQLAAWRLLEVTAPAALALRGPPIVDRTAELAQLLEAFARSNAEGRAQLVTVLGEPGIGKSRLAQELADRVRDDARVLVGRCVAYGEAITYWALRGVVTDAGAASYESVRALLGGVDHAEAIARRVAGAVGLLDAVHPVEEIRWAVRRLLETLARERPLVVGFDDLHWANPAFLDLVDHVVETSEAPILVVCLARPELLEDQKGWNRARRNGQLLTLAPLSREESGALLEGLHDSGPLLDEADRRRIVRAADGNPLFLEQLAAFAAERADDGHGGSLPTSLRTLLAARLDRLAPGERAVVEHAAVMGRAFWVDAIRDLLPPDGAAALKRHLESLTRRELLEPRLTSVPFMQVYRFRHSLIQEAAYHSLPKRQRAEAHERLARWIEGATRAAVGTRDRAVGHHLEQAYLYNAELELPGEDERELAERAAYHLAAAGRRASARGSPGSAANLLSRACALLPRGDPRRPELLLELGVERSEAGEPDHAEPALAEAIDEAVEASDRRIELRARLELAALHGFAKPRTAAAEIARVADEAIPIFEEASDHASLARAWHVLGYVDVWAVRWDTSGAAFERALAHARAAGDSREEAEIARWIARSILFGSTPARRASSAAGTCSPSSAAGARPKLGCSRRSRAYRPCAAASTRLASCTGGEVAPTPISDRRRGSRG